MTSRSTRREFLLAGGALAIAAGCGTGSSGSGGPGTSTASVALQGPRHGGTLRVGMLGGANDIVDGQFITAKPDTARLVAGWESLATYDENFNVSLDHGLAEEIESESPDRYTIRIREGIEFHNGKTLDADDVVYSFRRAIDPSLGINPALQALLAPSGITKVDARTVDIRLEQRAVTFLDMLALYAFGMVPEGYSRDDPNQVGTGPFQLESFDPGSESVHVRNPRYWQSDGPYLDEVRIIDFADSTALMNALRTGQVDCMVDVPYGLADTVAGDRDLTLLESEGGSWLPLTMAVDQPPFDDERVRRAFRLMVDRDELVERALAGHGRVANDMYAPLDPCFPNELPQRERDIEQARELLADAGQSELEIDLYAPNDIEALVAIASVFADHARDAGVTVNVRVLPSAEYWGEEYCTRTFASGFWGTRSYLPQVPLSSLHDAVHPETHWPPAGSDFASRYLEAIGTNDADARCEIVRAMQEEEYRDGGNIIAAFSNLVDAHRVGVRGLVARPTVLNLDHYGHGFKNIWLDA
ncbi:ABC transporter substrate-binding protein [Ilumatobacter nonamiensis]|uniref:ABC transporter substrate-binding protein n=1 Tax=Ilumatobacter nonamiensis TaxID=467093 RepID=UPI00034C3154|nr:ABC transporter substrate-binding protein [Ilumatobacter nonamiensis]